MSFKDTILPNLLLDGYKLFHHEAYDQNSSEIYSNFTNRSGKYSKTGLGFTVWVGTQAVVREYFTEVWGRFFHMNRDYIEQEYKRVVGAYLGAGSEGVDVSHILKLHDLGYLPLEIKSLPEGSLVPYNVPCLTLKNTHPDFFWLTNLVETHLSAGLWPISTAASLAYAYRKRFEEEPSIPHEAIKFMGHDFSYRGMVGLDGTVKCGMGHLTSFVGTDSVPAGLATERYYDSHIDKELVMASVRATEHSVETSNIFRIVQKMREKGETFGLSEDEINLKAEEKYMKKLLTEITPDGILSYVADGLDFWGVVDKVLPSLKDVIMSRNGQLVIRPDSGDPVDILCGVEPKRLFRYMGKEYMIGDIEEEGGWPHPRHDATEVTESQSKGLIECLWDIFGGTEVNGLKMLDIHIGAIYGDSITLDRQDKILNRLKDKGFVPTVVLGIGSYTYQYNTRDSEGSAVKATNLVLKDGTQIPVYKNPKTDPNKKSAKGLFKVTKDEQGNFKLHDNVTKEEEQSDENELKVVFKDSKLYNQTTLNEIRTRLWGSEF